MKRFITALVFVGLAGLVGMPRSAEAGIFSRWFGCRSSGSSVVTTTAPSSDATADAGRRYSYEPEVSSAPRRTTTDRVPLGQRQLLPKTDPRRYINE